MYDVIKNVIVSKRYELKDILIKIDTLWVQGSITDDQRTELIALAQKNAQIENSVDIMSKLEEMDKRMKALEAIVFAPVVPEEPNEGEDTSEGETDEPVVITYPEYEAGKWYYAGDIVSFNGEVYECIAPEGSVCVWSPADYPAYWQAVMVEELPEEEPNETPEEPVEPEVPEEEPIETPEEPVEEETQETIE